MPTRLRYLALLSDNPDELATFYKKRFALEELGRSNDGDISVTDGFFNISLLKRRAELHESRTGLGLHHIGLEVDDLDAVLERYKAFSRMPIVKEKGGVHFGDVRIFDPEGMPVSLSQKSFGVGDRPDRNPRIRHIACNALWPEGILNFYTLLFGFRELSASLERRQQGRHNRFCGDGHTNLAIHPFYNDSEGHEASYGVNHFGFLVDDVVAKLGELQGEVPTSKRPASRPYAEYRLRDPQGNMFDLSQIKGWEIAPGKWSKAA